MRALRPYLSSDAPVILDDYIERTFLFRRNQHLNIRHTSPWIGICHHPAKVPDWYGLKGLQSLDNHEGWQASFPHLKLVVTLGENLTAWVREHWRVPCITLRHPTGMARVKWSLDKFNRNQSKKVIQIGSFLRNTQSIYQVRVPIGLEKARLYQSADWIDSAHDRCSKMFAHRPNVGAVREMTGLRNQDYDHLLAENIVYLEFIDAVANNTVVECIARKTPLIVNRLPGAEFYLGKDYPLFYDDINDVHDMLVPETIAAASEHLRRLPKEWLSCEVFARSLAAVCRATLPELWPAEQALASPNSALGRLT
jgi:hypothetical protein